MRRSRCTRLAGCRASDRPRRCSPQGTRRRTHGPSHRCRVQRSRRSWARGTRAYRCGNGLWSPRCGVFHIVELSSDMWHPPPEVAGGEAGRRILVLLVARGNERVVLGAVVVAVRTVVALRVLALAVAVLVSALVALLVLALVVATGVGVAAAAVWSVAVAIATLVATTLVATALVATALVATTLVPATVLALT